MSGFSKQDLTNVVRSSTEPMMRRLLCAIKESLYSDIEWSLLCDDQGDGNVTEFYRRSLIVFDNDGAVVSTTLTDFELDKTTLYTVTGTVIACSSAIRTNTVDHALVDGYSGTLTQCSSWSFAWGSGGAGSFTINIPSTGRVVTYTYPNLPEIANAVDWSRTTLEDLVFDATSATGLYLNTQNCAIPVYEGLPEMIMEFTATGADTLILPLESGYTYNFDVDYGEGGGWERVEAFDDATATNIYAGAGAYDVKIRGVVGSINFGSVVATDDKMTDLKQWGRLLGLEKMRFDDCDNLVFTATDTPELSNLTTMVAMFRDCAALTTVPGIETWDVSNVTNMNAVFFGCAFNQDISAWDTSNVTNMSGMFRETTAFNQNINNWDTSNVTNMGAMFLFSEAYNQPVDQWDVSNVTNFNSIFEGALNPFNQSVEAWTLNPAGVSMAWAFANPNYNQPLNALDVSSVTLFSHMFDGATLFDQPLDSWDVTMTIPIVHAEALSFEYMFHDAVAFDQDISAWDTSNVVKMNNMFDGATSFDQDLSSWNVTSLTTATDMFDGVTLSTVNYDLILVGWEAQAVQNNVSIDFGGSIYSLLSAAATARADLIADHTWTIVDGGGV
jgi:surface protein